MRSDVWEEVVNGDWQDTASAIFGHHLLWTLLHNSCSWLLKTGPLSLDSGTVTWRDCYCNIPYSKYQWSQLRGLIRTAWSKGPMWLRSLLCAHNCCDERPFLSGELSVPSSWTAIGQRTFPLFVGLLVLRRITLVGWPASSAVFWFPPHSSRRTWAWWVESLSVLSRLFVNEHRIALRILRSMPSKKDPFKVCSLYTPAHRGVKSHEFRKKFDGVNEPCLKLSIFSLDG